MRERLENLVRVVALVCATALAACGGGGGDGGADGTIHVTFTPSRITAYVPVGQVGTALYVTAAVAPLPSEGTYVYVLDGSGILRAGATTVSANENGTFTAHLPLKDGLTAGVYEGTFTLQLCRDAACANPYPLTGGSLPYTITVTPHVTTTATAVIKVDDVIQSDTGETIDGNGARNYGVTMKTGATLELDTSVPVATWSFASGAPYPEVSFLGTSSQSVFRAIFSLSNPSDATESTRLRALAADGQIIFFNVTVTQ